MRIYRSSRLVLHAHILARFLGLCAAVLGLLLLIGTGAASAVDDRQLEASILQVLKSSR